MLLVVEGDGLTSLETLAQVDEKEEQENPRTQSDQKGFHLTVPLIGRFSPLRTSYNNTSFDLQRIFFCNRQILVNEVSEW